MKSLSTLALTLSLTGALMATAAEAKKKEEAAPAVAPGARVFNFSKAARPLLATLQKAVIAKDAAGYAAALAPAQAAATTPDDKYTVAQLQLKYALDTQNTAGQMAAIDALIQSGGALPTELPALYSNLAAMAINAKDNAKASYAYERLLELNPNDPTAIVNLSEIRNRQGRKAEGVQLLDRAIAAKQASGQVVDENWYKRAVGLSTDAKLTPQALKSTRDWIGAYPTQQNWRDGLSNYRYLTQLDTPAELDRLRLMRAAGALQGERSYLEYAEVAFAAGLPGESQAVLQEGIRARIVDANKPAYKDLLQRSNVSAAKDKPTLGASEAKASASATGKLSQNLADAYLSYGDYAKAATLYRAAMTKGGVDANLVNTRLGIALAMSGDKAGASTAFSAVTGPRQDLARFWTLWVSKRA